MGALTVLQLLHLSNFMIGTDQQGFQQMQELQQLQTLILVNGKGNWTTTNLPGLSKLTKLQRLQISNCGNLEPAMLQSFAANRLLHVALDGIHWKRQPYNSNVVSFVDNPELSLGMLAPWFSQQQELTHSLDAV